MPGLLARNTESCLAISIRIKMRGFASSVRPATAALNPQFVRRKNPKQVSRNWKTGEIE
jgi:uncharacterized protein (UPF0303 family)